MAEEVAATVVVAATAPICRRQCTGRVDTKLFNLYTACMTGLVAK